MARHAWNAAGIPLLTFGVVVALLLLSRQPNSNPTSASPALDDSPTRTSATATPTATLTPTPTPTPIPPPVRIRIPAIGVDAPMSEVGVTPDGRVEEPSGPDEVAWTNGGARPGSVGNAILSGHFDWSIPAPRGAVFFRLRELKQGDKVTITLASGVDLSYAVVSSTLYLASAAPGDQILAQTPEEIITMITCEGTYNRELRDYSHRRVVVARKIHA